MAKKAPQTHAELLQLAREVVDALGARDLDGLTNPAKGYLGFTLPKPLRAATADAVERVRKQYVISQRLDDRAVPMIMDGAAKIIEGWALLKVAIEEVASISDDEHPSGGIDDGYHKEDCGP